MKVKASPESNGRLAMLSAVSTAFVSTSAFRNVCDQQWRNRAYDLVLKSRIHRRAFCRTVRPAMRAGLCIDQLCSNAHAITAAADAPFQHVTDTQLAANLADIGSRSLYWNDER